MSSPSEARARGAGDEGPRSILRSPGSGTMKAVQISSEPPESISPLMMGESKHVDSFDLDRQAAPKQHRTRVASAKLTGRPAIAKSRSVRGTIDSPVVEGAGSESASSSRPESSFEESALTMQVIEWLGKQRAKRTQTKAVRAAIREFEHLSILNGGNAAVTHTRRPSDSSSVGTDALDELELIVQGRIHNDRTSSRRAQLLVSRPSRQKLRRLSTASETTATEYGENEDLVPTCDVMLDNSKTLSYHGGRVEEPAGELQEHPGLQLTSAPSKDPWKTFKYEIVRLSHTLRLRGWRRVPMQMSSQIAVIRLSGALTNAVYEVLPPKELPSKTTDTVDGTVSAHPKAAPQKLLLRIYGTNVDNLIDREAELQILRRLRRKNIGPRLLGCFSNGRFEEFFHAEPLKSSDLRDPATSVQIAKRMRELHEGMDLLPLEREEGSFVWCNINRWMSHCAKIVTWLDAQAKNDMDSSSSRAGLYVCGTEWTRFQEVLLIYKDWLLEKYGGPEGLKEHLVFAHNDTQYGNILRMSPEGLEGESPLLTPANAYRRLQVIDFEYANANTVGLEFANHFTEWCYNYHDEKAPHACNTKIYPTPDEQHRFIRAYLTHTPHFATTSATPTLPAFHDGTPQLSATPSSLSLSNSLVSSFTLEPRYPVPTKASKPSSITTTSTANSVTGPYPESTESSAAPNTESTLETIEAKLESDTARLRYETRIWRLANSAQWTMWGVMRAKIPGLPDFEAEEEARRTAASTGTAGTATQTSSIGPPGSGSANRNAEDDATADGGMEREQREDGTDAVNATGNEAISADRQEKEQEREGGGEEAEEEEFDYLGYAWERAMFFWGDAVALGLVELEDLPERVRSHVKLVPF